MAYLIKSAIKYINFIDEYGDPRVSDWFLFDVVYMPLAGLLTYYYILFQTLPKWMKERQPYNLDNILIVYNAVQIVACTYVVYECCDIILFNLFDLECQNVDYSASGSRELTVCWLYFIIKVIDMFDTIFFRLRKKDNQVSFLHLYHHGGMCMATWGMTKFYGGGSSLFIPFLNSIVHIFMYGYYLLSVYQKGQTWLSKCKRHITQLQLVQFCILLFILLRLALSQKCNIPSWIAWVLTVQNFFFILLFTDFYVKTYIYGGKKTMAGRQGYTKVGGDNGPVNFTNLSNHKKNEKAI